MLKENSIKGPGWIILQVLRVFTIIGLLTAAVACWTLIIKIDTSKGWFFFDATSLFFTSTISVFLVISELPFVRTYFENNWPAFSKRSGLTWLGVAMAIIGCNILGKLNQPSNTSKKLGMPFWRLVLAAGILSITFGIFNIVCSFIFSNSASGINARMVRSDGTQAKSIQQDHGFNFKDNYSSRSNSLKSQKPKESFMRRFWGKKTEQQPTSSLRPEISAPMPSMEHQQYDVERDPAYSPSNNRNPHGDDWDRSSPIAPGVQRPPTVLHPMHTGYSSRYSEASISRF